MKTNRTDLNAEALDQAAAEWFFRRDAGLTTAEQAELAAWLEDPRQAEAFAEIEATWAQSLQVRDRVMAATLEFPAPGRASVPRTRRWLGLSAAVAAAAAVAVGYFAWWQPAHYAGVMTTAVGEIRQWRLPDGSTVDLNTDSTVTVAYSFGERQLRLEQGEAHFAVAKNPERPFTVAAGEVSVRAVGTAFNVRRREEAVDVMVTEGKVKVAAPMLESSTTELAPVGLRPRDLFVDAGHRVSVALVAKAEVPALPAVEAVPAPVIEQSLAWQQRKVEFADASLGEMVAEFNRYNRHQLVIDDTGLAAMRFGGSFPADDYESFVRVLEGAFDVRATRRGNETVLHRKP